MHTAGPWHRNIRASGHYPVVFSGRNNHVATASQQADPAETEANIDLIAAAPELLGALRAMLDQFKDHAQYDDADAEAVNLALAAINKATGVKP